MISNISEFIEYYNKYDYSCYVVETEPTALYIAPNMPSIAEYAVIGGEFYDNATTSVELLEKSIYLLPVNITSTITHTLSVNNKIIVDYIEYDDDATYADFVEITTTTGKFVIQPDVVKVVADKLELYITPQLPLESINITEVKLMKIMYVRPSSVSPEKRVVLPNDYTGTIYKITNSAYNNTVIMNSYGVSVLKSTTFLTEESISAHTIFSPTQIISNTIKNDYIEISSDTKIASNKNRVVYEVRDKNLAVPSTLIISKNGEPVSTAPNYQKNKLVYIKTPLLQISTALLTWQYPVRQEVHYGIDKIKLQEYNMNELVQNITYSNQSDKVFVEDYSGSPTYQETNKEYTIDIDFLSDTMLKFENNPKQIMLIKENYVWDI